MSLTSNTFHHSNFYGWLGRRLLTFKFSLFVPLLIFTVAFSSGCSEENRPAQRLPIAADTAVEQSSAITY